MLDPDSFFSHMMIKFKYTWIIIICLLDKTSYKTAYGQVHPTCRCSPYGDPTSIPTSADGSWKLSTESYIRRLVFRNIFIESSTHHKSPGKHINLYEENATHMHFKINSWDNFSHYNQHPWSIRICKRFFVWCAWIYRITCMPLCIHCIWR